MSFLRAGRAAAVGLAAAVAVAATGTVARSAPLPSFKKMAARDYRTQADRDYWMTRDGEHGWLEEVGSDRSLEWVRQVNEEALKALGRPDKSALYDRVLSILDSKEKIPHVRRIGSKGRNIYNFWQDAENPRGLWRRTTLEEYPNGWETVIDVDALGKAEGESWVWKGHDLCEAHDDPTVEPTRTLVKLSRGGADACVVREFDMVKKEFVKDGFVVPECKSSVSWLTPNKLLIGTDFGGDGSEMTDSGYPRTLHEWDRGTPLSASVKVFEGAKTDVAVGGGIDKHGGHKYEWRSRSLTFYTNRTSVRFLSAADGSKPPSSGTKWVELDKLPADAEASQFADYMLVSLRSAWTVQGTSYPAGSLLAVNIGDFIDNATEATFKPMFVPDETTSLDGWTRTQNYLVLQKLETIKSRLEFWSLKEGKTKGVKEWVKVGQEDQAQIRGCGIRAVDDERTDDVFVTVNSFLQPDTLYYASAAKGPSMMKSMKMMKELPRQFDSTGLVCEQYQAKSKDGTMVPYFVVRREQFKFDGSHPTLLYGYGGFEISLTPSYAPVTGAAWLETGGVYVSANIRGGGEFGPSWHQAALKAHRQAAYDDFIAVAEDLIKRGITQPSRLGIRGGSNGGLLMGNMYVQRPDLWGAVVCQVPLLDMKRFNHLLAGASWMAEYGNPDKEEDWKFMQQYSAYHNFNRKTMKGEDGRYPPLLMTTSTRDDRVHPYHARSFVRRLRDHAGPNSGEVHYYENIEGGHGGAADSKQQAFMTLLYFDFLRDKIAGGGKYF